MRHLIKYGGILFNPSILEYHLHVSICLWKLAWILSYYYIKTISILVQQYNMATEHVVVQNMDKELDQTQAMNQCTVRNLPKRFLNLGKSQGAILIRL